jgi:asparagine synthase (glutamine-hydrolysing)
MCGIAGQLDFTGPDPAAVRRMTDALAHRGPDGDGFYSDGHIALGHLRLSIIDVDGGAQPQFNEDDTLAVILNGEIYNYKELMAELQPRHPFKTRSDTEVLLHLYEELGDDLLGRLHGMFAFALWDGRRKRLLLARDRFGEKPLYYSRRGGRLTFASELGALVQAGVATGGIDRKALSDYLELLYVPAPRTIYAGIEKLPAAHALVADAQGVAIRPYWTPPVPGSEARTPITRPQELRAALRESVRLRLRSDVPLAALLSGGIDSSAVVGLMAEELGPGVKTFSVGFGSADDELPHARVIAERFRTEHHEILVQSDLRTQVDEAFGAYSEPFGDSSSVPTVAVCKEVAKHVKVVLSGDGGDELFAGYGQYRRVARIPHLPLGKLVQSGIGALPTSAFKRRALRFARSAGASGVARHRALIEVFSADERAELLGGERRVAAGPAGVPDRDVDAALAFDLGVYLPDDLLVKTDIAAMHFGLEGRCPFLDQELAALAVPPAADQKQNATEGKLLLKAALGDLLPEEILRRPKRGFGSPVGEWLKGPLRPMLEERLRPANAKVREWLDGKAVDRVLDEVTAGRGNGHQGWALLALEAWAERSGG